MTAPLRLRAVEPILALGLTRDEGIAAARANYSAARKGYLEVLGVIGGYRMLELLSLGRTISVPALRATRDEAQTVVTKALAVVSALNAALDACERVTK